VGEVSLDSASRSLAETEAEEGFVAEEEAKEDGSSTLPPKEEPGLLALGEGRRQTK
jgi:hypothetical protein